MQAAAGDYIMRDYILRVDCLKIMLQYMFLTSD
jgi:hypothetical protein